MRKFIYILHAVLVIALVSCEEGVLPKPKHLIKKDKMVDMLVDMHLAEATYEHLRPDTALPHITSVNFYYSILDKYQVPDSVFEQSFVYYASMPKEFEKIYRKVTSRLSEKEQELSGRKEELLKFDDKSKQ